MGIRIVLVFALIASSLSMAFAASQGTPEQRAACGPDVRKFCYKLKESEGDDVYLQCLEINRDKLSAPCLALLKNYGK
jgi:hypothetical protein